MNIQQALAHIAEHRNLDHEQMSDVVLQIMTGNATPAQIGGFLMAMRMKGETVEEVAAAASVMRSLADKVELKVESCVDIVGTGGDVTHTFNVSTTSALVAAAAGIRIAKHGNRSVSSQSGAADLLEISGVNINLKPAQVARCVEEIGIGFMFALNHHGAMKHAIGPRRELATRTLFNLLGPLINPALAPNQVLGVFDAGWVRPIADVLQQLGSHHVMVVCGDGGMDEITCTGPTQVAELRDGKVVEYTIEPGEFGIQVQPLEAIQVSSPGESLAMIEQVLAGQPGAPRDIVLLNAGAAIYVGGLAQTHEAGIAMAASAIDEGKAAAVFERLKTFTQQFAEKN